MSKIKFPVGLRQLKGKIKTYKVFGFDVETFNNNKDFLCASLVGDNYEKFYTYKKIKGIESDGNLQDLKKELYTNRIFRNSYVCATNLLFDFFSMFPIKEALDNFRIIERQGALVFAQSYCKYKNPTGFYTNKKIYDMKKALIVKDKGREFYKITFIDTLNHLKGSVNELGNIIDLNKLTSPKCLGLEPKKLEEWFYMKKYNIRDSSVTYNFMEWLQRQYNIIGCNMKPTISSTALDLYRRQYLKGFWKQESRAIILKEYLAYYGGRTEAFKRGIFKQENYGKMYVYDFVSLYPSVLHDRKYPIPKSYQKAKPTTDDIDSFEGIAKFTLKAPYMHIPYLPSRTDKLLFPYGIITGYYDFFSIRQAIKLGYEIIKVSDGIIYEHTFRPFKEFIHNVFKTRKEWKKRNDNSQLVPKIIMNSFYGKLGFNFSNKELIMSYEDLSLLPDFDKVSVYPYMIEGCDFCRVKTTEKSKIPSYVFPIYPTYTTAYARDKLHKAFMSTGEKRVFYCDTDSVFTNRKQSSSNEMGELQLEKTFKEIAIVKPKFYGGYELQKGKDEIKVKGLRNIGGYDHFKNMLETNKFQSTNVVFRKLRGSIKNGYINEVYNVKKHLELDDNKRLWDFKNFSMKPQESKPLIIK